MRAILLIAGIALLAGSESRAATMPPPSPAFSPDTAACINKAAADQAACNLVTNLAACQFKYDRALPSCFAPGKGVTAAAACVARGASLHELDS